MKNLIIGLVRLYQKTLSPNHGPGFFNFPVGCRFYPSCSEYSIQAIEKFGVSKGIFKSLIRILKCGPWSRGGIDLV